MSSAESWFSNILITFLLLQSVLSEAQKLDKPPLLSDFNDLDNALKDNLPKTNYSKVVRWEDQWILDDCKKIAENEKFSLSDIETFEVYYDERSSPWLLCRHKNSPDPDWHFFELFCRIPVRARSHVKGMIMLPADYDYGYNDNNYIAIRNQQRDGHHDWKQSNCDDARNLWHSAYNNDSKVPDTYASKDFLEDVAQITVIATYDLVIPDGLGTMSQDWHSIQHQYELIRKEQAEADPSNLLVPGGECVHRLNNSHAVPMPATKVRKAARRTKMARDKPNTDLADGMEIIDPIVDFTTKDTWPRPQ